MGTGAHTSAPTFAPTSPSTAEPFVAACSPPSAYLTRAAAAIAESASAKSPDSKSPSISKSAVFS